MLWWVMVKRDRVVMLDDDGGGETIWALMSMGVVVDMVRMFVVVFVMCESSIFLLHNIGQTD